MPTEALRYELSIARAVVEAAVDAIAIIDENGSIESANPALERLSGYSRDEILGQNVKLLMLLCAGRRPRDRCR